MRNEYKQILRYGFGMLVVVAGLLSIFFAATSYQAFEQLFKVFQYEKRFTGNDYAFGFSFKTYQVIIGALTFITIGSLFLFYRFRFPSQNHKVAETFGFYLKTIGFPIKKLLQQWTLLPKWEKYLLLVTGTLLILNRIYLLNLHPVITDEAATYLLFVSKGLHASLAYYPLPNNHILYSVLCLPFGLVFDKAYWVLKLPSFLISLLMFPIVYLSLRSVFKFPVAFIVTIGCCFSNYALYYAVHGRGYTLLLFCTIIASLAMLKIVQQKAPVYWLLFMLASIAGFLTIPVFLYPFGSLVIFGASYFFISKNFHLLQNLIIACIFISFITLLLYLPAILVSGSSQLYNNEYVQAGNRQLFFQKLPFYAAYMHGAMLGQETLGKYLWLGSICLFLILLVFRRQLMQVYRNSTIDPVVLCWVLSGSVLPFFLLTIHGVMPPERIWLFLTFANFLLLGISYQVVVSLLSGKFQKAVPVLTVVFMTFYLSYQVVKQQVDYHADQSQSMKTERSLRDIHQFGHRTVFSNCNAYGINIIYEFLYAGERDYVFDENIPAPARMYDVVILGTENAPPIPIHASQYSLFYQDPRVQIYFRRK